MRDSVYTSRFSSRNKSLRRELLFLMPWKLTPGALRLANESVRGRRNANAHRAARNLGSQFGLVPCARGGRGGTFPMLAPGVAATEGTFPMVARWPNFGRPWDPQFETISVKWMTF